MVLDKKDSTVLDLRVKRPSPLASKMTTLMFGNKSHWHTAALYLIVSIFDGISSISLDLGVLQDLVTDKVPSDKWVVTGPWICLGNGTVSELDLCTNGSWRNAPVEEWELAMMRDLFVLSINVAATYVCGDNPTCFKRVTAAALTKAEAIEEVVCIAWKSTANGTCMEADREHWPAIEKVGSNLTDPLAMRVAFLVQKVKGDIAAGDVQRIPFKTQATIKPPKLQIGHVRHDILLCGHSS